MKTNDLGNERIMSFLREVANPTEDWEYEDGNSMARDMTDFLAWVKWLEADSKESEAREEMEEEYTVANFERWLRRVPPSEAGEVNQADIVWIDKT